MKLWNNVLDWQGTYKFYLLLSSLFADQYNNETIFMGPSRSTTNVTKALKLAKKALKPSKQLAKDVKVTMIYDGTFVCPICKQSTTGLRDQGQHLTCLDTIGGKKKWKAALLTGAAKDKASTTVLEDMETAKWAEKWVFVLVYNVFSLKKNKLCLINVVILLGVDSIMIVIEQHQ